MTGGANDFIIRLDNKTGTLRSEQDMLRLVEDIKAVANLHDFDVVASGDIEVMTSALYDEKEFVKRLLRLSGLDKKEM